MVDPNPAAIPPVDTPIPSQLAPSPMPPAEPVPVDGHEPHTTSDHGSLDDRSAFQGPWKPLPKTPTPTIESATINETEASPSESPEPSTRLPSSPTPSPEPEPSKAPYSPTPEPPHSTEPRAPETPRPSAKPAPEEIAADALPVVVTPPPTAKPTPTPTVTPAPVPVPLPVPFLGSSSNASSNATQVQATVGEKSSSMSIAPPAPTARSVPSKGGKSTDQSSHESVESSNNKSGGSKLYSMGTASIMSIVGVVVGIAVIVLLFVAISRKNYDEDSDDEDDPRRLGCQIDGGRPIARLSPTFLMNGSSHAFAASNRLGAQPASPVDLREPSTDSAQQWSGDSEFLDSRDSDGWSSVLESDYEHGGVSRCTRDTNLSSIMLSQNFSEYNRSTGARRTTALGYGSDTSAAYRNRSRSQRNTRHERSEDSTDDDLDLGNEQIDTFSEVSFDVDQAKRANGTALPAARSTAASSFYRGDSMASDFRSTDASEVAARYVAR
ncbi:hypothetical protein PINS_up010198 [Pythium insidiosum]|nr:hypothetical protein PINS_up010198 [Pythium insidiosum]